MTSLDWTGEQFPAHGALAAEGLSKLLGRPNLDPLTVLIRETAQNSWDARLPRVSVQYRIDGFEVDEAQRGVLLNDVFSDRPPAGLSLAKSLGKSDLAVLVISDRRTKGLGGPTRADRPTTGPTDYVDLLMNVGVPSRNELGGGTYGFGKTIAYVVSAPRTIIIHSRTDNGLAKRETRLICAAIGEEFDHGRRRYTGRHWWGKNRSGAPEPVTGKTAEKLARAIGFPGFADDETGTSVMIIDPVFGEREPLTAMRFISEAITWHLWPKMVKVRGRQPMHFAVTWAGQEVPVRHPSDLPPLQGFVPALEAVRSDAAPFKREDGLELVEIRSKLPDKTLGRLAINTFVARPRPAVAPVGPTDDDDLDQASSAAAFSGNAHHVALIRAPELIVSYLPGPELPDGALEWGGVFACDRDTDIDKAFAAAEPPTHDDWQPQLVTDKRQKRTVNVALREIKLAARARLAEEAGPQQGGNASVARIADALAGLVVGMAGSGAGRSPRPGGNGPAPRRKTRIAQGVCGPILVEGERRSRLAFSLEVAGERTVTLSIRTGVATNDGTGLESDPPLGSTVPVIIAVDGPTPMVVDPAGLIEVTAEVSGTTEWTVLATSPDGVMVAFDVDVVEGGAA